MSQMDKAQIHLFADSVLCLGDSAMNESRRKFTKRWTQYFQTAGYYKSKSSKCHQPQETARQSQFVKKKKKKRWSCVLKEAQNNAASFVWRGSKPGYSCSTFFQVARHFPLREDIQKWMGQHTLHKVVLKESCSWA